MQKFSVIPFEFDTRMVEWNIKHNVINKDQLEKYLKSLPAEDANVSTIQIADLSDATESQNH